MRHTLPDVLKPNLDVVFCGTAASAKAAKLGAYYANPTNRFWKTLFEIGLTPREFEPPEFEAVVEFGIGFTDLAKHTSGQDASLKQADFDTASFRTKVERFAPKVVAFNGKRAASVFLGIKSPNYGLQAAHIAATATFVLPSTSALAKKFWDIRYWQELADFVGK